MRFSPALRAPFNAALVGVVLFVAACGSAGNSTGGSANNNHQSGSGSTTVKTGNPSSPVTIQEAGSSLMFPYLQQMPSQLKAKYPNITLAPAAGGSGAGISQAAAGTINLGASDAYLTPAQFQQYTGILNIPAAVSAQGVFFNLPGISSLNLSGNVLAQIYMGKITKWNDTAIAKLNSGVTLPSTTIVPIRRVDSSGDTFSFTSFLSQTNQAWANGPALGATVTWPAVRGELAVSGNPAMVQSAKATPGGIAYIGVSVEAQALQAGLGQASLQNRAGKFVKPDQQTISSAVEEGAKQVPANLAVSLIYQPGAQSYPIVNLEYMIVLSHQTNADMALALRTFLVWLIGTSGGASESNLAAVNFQPMPKSFINPVKQHINKIQAGS